MYLICVTVACRAVNDLYYLIAGGLSKKPGQVGDSRVNHTICHVTTKAWQTHIETDSEGASERKKPREDVSPFVCLFLALFNAIFYSTDVYLTVAYYLYLTLFFSETFGIIIVLL